jgi:hypothetical protein
VGEVDSERGQVEEWEALEQKGQLGADEQGKPIVGLEGPRSCQGVGRLALPVPEGGGFQDQMGPAAATQVPKRQKRWGWAGTNSTPFGNPCTFGKAGGRLGSLRTGRHGM